MLDYAQLFKVAEAAHRSGLYAKFKSAEQVFAVMARGAEVGLPPFTACEVFHVIQGTPRIGKSGLAMLLTMNGYRLTWRQNDATAAEVCVTHPARGEFVSRFTFDDAKRAGYTKNAKYNTEPADMLASRALSRVCSTFAAHVLGAMPLILEDEGAAPAPAMLASSAPLALPAPAPVVDVAEVLDVRPAAPATLSRAETAALWLAERDLLEAAYDLFGPTDSWSEGTIDEIRSWASEKVTP
jgi:hypothetical protein